jgi:threonylcarbamoyladenosine tRNA methylthiotransferase MtaB
VIVGFPGESGGDFQETMNFLEAAKFSHIHTFRFSRRTGTKADSMKDQVNGKIMTERSEHVRLYSEKIRLEYLQSMIGKRQRVLVEKVESGVASGYGEHYVPVKFVSEDASKNRFEDVELTGVEGDSEYYMIGDQYLSFG